jgi:hypothetical protein
MRPRGWQQAYGGEQRAVELLLLEEVNCVLAIIAIDLLISDYRDVPAGTIHEYSLAVAVHLYEVRLEKSAVLGVHDDDHPSLLTSVREEFEGTGRVGEYP